MDARACVRFIACRTNERVGEIALQLSGPELSSMNECYRRPQLQHVKCQFMWNLKNPGWTGQSFTSHFTLQVPSMVEGGALWFTDLTSADPYYGLPILTGSFMLAMVQLNAAEGMQGQSPSMIKNFKIAMSVLAVAIIPFSYLLPKVGRS